MTTDDSHAHLHWVDRTLAAMTLRPRTAMFVAVGLVTAAGWIYFAAMLSQMGSEIDLRVFGPGMSVFSGLFGDVSSSADHSTLHQESGLLAMPGLGSWGFRDISLVFFMWVMMACAMMMPTAAPMLSTYADIADTAARSGKYAVSVFVLALGYLAIWIGFGAAATMVQWGLTELRLMSPLMEPVAQVFAGTTILAAGIYQFTPAKAACLIRCQNPFPFFFAKWTDKPAGVFRLGLEQGLFCLGCCWALMCVMFAVGVMNIVAIAALTLIMALEKTFLKPWFSKTIGIALISFGALVLVLSEPGRAICGI